MNLKTKNGVKSYEFYAIFVGLHFYLRYSAKNAFQLFKRNNVHPIVKVSVVCTGDNEHSLLSPVSLLYAVSLK